MKKRYFLPLLAALLLFSLLSPVFAVETDTTEPTEPTITIEARLEAELIAACRYGQALDISQYDLTPEELDSLFHRLYDTGQLPWYVQNAYSYEHRDWGDRQHVLNFTPELLKDGYDHMAYEQQVQELLADCDLQKLENWQKALVLHDRLILRCRYDESLEKNSGYDLLINGSTVCAGYAALYQDLLQRVGIPCLIVHSAEMNHAWNLIQLEGNWYHVDLTWDDPIPDLEGRVLHTYFLRTDSQMQEAERPHYGWVTDISCTDESYSDAFWTDVDTQILFTDKTLCHYGKTTNNLVSIFRRDLSKNNSKRIYEEGDNFIDVGNGRKRYRHVGLFRRNGRLWICTMTKVLSMKPDGKNRQTEFTYAAAENGKYIAGFRLSDTTLLLQLEDCDQTVYYQEESLPPVKNAHTHSYRLTTVAPTCAAEGYDLSTCDCGIEAKANYTAPDAHNWLVLDSKKATFKADGYTDRECTVCGYREYLELPKLEAGSWLRVHWYYIIFGLMLLLLVVNLLPLLQTLKKP